MPANDKEKRAKERAQRPLRIAMLGMIDGNAHPYSWSAIINGYEPGAMKAAIGDRYPVILDYLGDQPAESVRLPGARVTHVWTDDPREAPKIAAATKIPVVLEQPEKAIGEIDAAIIATDDGGDHLERARPFIEAGLPVFIDKPLATNLHDLRRFFEWERQGKTILSSSGLRYAPELAGLRARISAAGDLRWLTATTVKTWERYGVHALEPVFTLLGPGVESVTNVASNGANFVTLRHAGGAHATIAILPDAAASSGAIHVYGTKGHLAVRLADTYTAFRNQMLAFIQTLESGRSPFPFSETIEIMLVLIAGLRSREDGGRTIEMESLKAEFSDPGRG